VFYHSKTGDKKISRCRCVRRPNINESKYETTGPKFHLPSPQASDAV
ncbi:hypothetical protein, partial [Neisseria meningitidis serogroup B]